MREAGRDGDALGKRVAVRRPSVLHRHGQAAGNGAAREPARRLERRAHAGRTLPVLARDLVLAQRAVRQLDEVVLVLLERQLERILRRAARGLAQKTLNPVRRLALARNRAGNVDLGQACAIVGHGARERERLAHREAEAQRVARLKALEPIGNRCKRHTLQHRRAQQPAFKRIERRILRHGVHAQRLAVSGDAQRLALCAAAIRQRCALQHGGEHRQVACVHRLVNGHARLRPDGWPRHFQLRQLHQAGRKDLVRGQCLRARRAAAQQTQEEQQHTSRSFHHGFDILCLSDSPPLYRRTPAGFSSRSRKKLTRPARPARPPRRPPLAARLRPARSSPYPGQPRPRRA